MIAPGTVFQVDKIQYDKNPGNNMFHHYRLHLFIRNGDNLTDLVLDFDKIRALRRSRGVVYY